MKAQECPRLIINSHPSKITALTFACLIPYEVLARYTVEPLLQTPLNSRHPATPYIMDSFHGPNCTQTIHNDLDLVATHQGCPPLLPELTT